MRVYVVGFNPRTADGVLDAVCAAIPVKVRAVNVAVIIHRLIGNWRRFFSGFLFGVHVYSVLLAGSIEDGLWCCVGGLTSKHNQNP